MAEHRDDNRAHDDRRNRETDGVRPHEGRDGLAPKLRPSYDDVGRAEAAERGRWRFSSAVEAARHLHRR